MAEKRMFSKKIIDTDWFMDMPSSTQNLYFHLSMRADDDGFVSSPKRIIRLIGASEDDYKLLIAKKFIIPFESGVCVITDWRINNYLRNDRHTDTIYQEEKNLLTLDEKGKYNLGIPQVDLEYTNTNSISNSNTNTNTKQEKKEKQDIPYNEIIDYLNEKSGKHYRSNIAKTKTFIDARYKENFKLEDFKKVIDKKSKEWKNTDMEKYLRPETLFGTKFEGYLNESEKTFTNKNNNQNNNNIYKNNEDLSKEELDQLFESLEEFDV